MQADVLDRIVADRRRRIDAEGAAQGVQVPADRPDSLPVVPFPQPLICEIKRRSPSRGDLAATLDPVARAAEYGRRGAGAVSVLTEQDHFAGSLGDLIAVKSAHPQLAVLRKDFLLDAEDVRISWRAGADAILLIAAILDRDTLRLMLEEAAACGIAALVEIHDTEDLEKIRTLRPAVVGINSRDLRSFRVDLLTPMELGQRIDWPCRRVFESGVFHPEDVLLARDGGFDAVLVGESVVRDPQRVSLLAQTMAHPHQTAEARAAAAAPPRRFWPSVAAARRRRPLVKICGITTVEDARLAQDLGADLLGVVYAPSRRRAPEGLAQRLVEAGIAVPLVAVVVEPDYDGHVQRAREDLEAGWISALQLHGNAAPEEKLSYGWPSFAAFKPAAPAEAREAVAAARSPRFLIDARHPTLAGGSGRQVDPEVLSAVVEALADRPHGELWLAGGLGPDNVGEVIATWRPELIDASSRLEAEPGRKDPGLLRKFFAAIDAVAERTE